MRQTDGLQSYANQAAESSISKQECQAMRALERDEDYSRTEIAFMFECQIDTVKPHVERDCTHIVRPTSGGPDRRWSDTELLTAFRLVRDRCPFPRMSKQQYDKHASENLPSSDTITTHLGGWSEVREKAGGYEA